MTQSYFARFHATASAPVTLECDGRRNVVKCQQDLVVAARAMLLKHRQDLTLRVGKQSYTLRRKDALGETARIVPSQAPVHPLVAFVAHAPALVDAARGTGLAGAVGATFAREYLEPLGLTRDEVLVTHVTPLATEKHATELASHGAWRGWVERELDRYNPAIVVALGRLAKAALGTRADVMLPHPGTVSLRKSENGELPRKLRALAQRIAKLRHGSRTVRIGKAAPVKQIVYGAALDPYQFDSQDDWVPAWEVEKTAHDYLQESRVVNLQHDAPARAQVVESWLVHYPTDDDYRAAMQNDPHRVYKMPIGNQQVHSGTWMLGVRIDDSGVWQAVQDGQITAFSIGGTGYRSDVDRDTALPQVTFVQP